MVNIKDEETYIKEIGQIIRRDYFPGQEIPNESSTYIHTPADIKDTQEITSLMTDPGSFQPKVHNKSVIGLDDYFANNQSEDNIVFASMVEKSNLNKDRNLAILHVTGDELPKITNCLHFVPEGTEMNAEEKSRLEKCRQRINKKATRLSAEFLNLQNRRLMNIESRFADKTVLSGRIGPDGKEIAINEGAVRGGYIPTPSPVPGVEQSPILCWGEIDGTPMTLAQMTPVSQFKIPDVPQRDKIGFELARKAADEKKKKRVLSSINSTRKSSSRFSIESFSPAARNLLMNNMSSSSSVRRQTPVTRGDSLFSTNKKVLNTD